jgi:UDP-glucose 4-epimerase
MKVLVTGGAGFIGSNIVDLLISEGYEVVVIDDLSTGKAEYVNEKATFYRMDLVGEGLENVLNREKVDFVLHQAAQVQVRKSLLDPNFDAKVNILGSINLLECCRDVEKFIYASSGGAVYGEPEYLPVDERHPIRPLSPYGASKYAVEKYLHAYKEIYGLDYISLRYGNVYGPRQDPYGEAGVVAIFANKMLHGKRPTIFGDGNQTRDFIYVEDVANANLLAMEKNTRNEVFNIATGEETSVNKIFEIIQESLKTNLKPVHDPPIKGEVRRIYLDVKRAEKKLGWKPKVGLREGIERFLDYLR